LEYDTANSENAIYKENDIGTKLFSSEIDICENPHILRAFGIDYGSTDDDCQPIKLVSLVESGVLKNFIKSKRFDTIAHYAQSRMFCLCIKNNMRGASLNETISDVKNAIVVRDIYAGRVNAESGIFSLFCGTCHYVQNGVVTGRISRLSISDEVKSIRRKIVRIGNDSKCFIGKCTKNGQTLTVGQSSPTIVLKG
jgi:predicted Zn-dependent protease